ncbi:hypothetical protein, partial [Achromobacter dolens]|uniref:hypothetical protein n=1 Tax=Achromobacter dolens TaxID=1287738 RepID=UPI0031D77D91
HVAHREITAQLVARHFQKTLLHDDPARPIGPMFLFNPLLYVPDYTWLSHAHSQNCVTRIAIIRDNVPSFPKSILKGAAPAAPPSP